jgi:tetratricopeptide (TPR) repeat protein
VADEQAGDRHGGIHAGGDLTVEGEGHWLAGGHIIEAETYIANAVIQEAAPSASLGLLPPDVSDFTGRDSELERLEAELLASNEQAVVISAVAGKPGVGKSALAVHLAHRLSPRFPDGQVYVNLRGADQQPLQAESALTELLEVLGMPGDQQPVSLDGKAAMWRRQVAGRRVLVVLDNARDEAQVRPLLPGSPTCAVLVTSRSVLATLGAKPLLLDILDSDQAVELLSKIVGRERIDAERPAALAVVDLCGGLPLALRIAGARLAARPDWQVTRLAERLTDERRRLAVLGMGDLDVRTSFQLSYQELDGEHARLFSLLSLWPGRDFHWWIAAVLLDVDLVDLHVTEELVDTLVAAQLVEPAQAPGRFRMHDLLRLFAREHLDHDFDIDQTSTIERLLGAVAGLVGIANAGLQQQPGLRQNQSEDKTTVDREEALGWLEAERDGLVAMASDAAYQGSGAAIWQLAERLSPFLSLRAYWFDWERVQRWALQAAQQAGDRIAAGRALGNLANALVRQGRWREGVDSYHEVLLIFRELGDRLGEAQTLGNLGTVLADQGHWRQAVDRFQQALTMYRELHDQYGEAQTLGNIGTALGNQGHWQHAITRQQQALGIFRKLGERHGQAVTLINLGRILAVQGHWQQAMDCYEEALTIFRELGDRHGEAIAHTNLGRILSYQGQWQEALDCYQMALAIYSDLGDRHGEAQALNNFSAVLAKQGQLQEAEEGWLSALGAFQELGDLNGEAGALGNLGAIQTSQGQWQQAADSYRQALAIFQELGDRHGQAQTLSNLGAVLRNQGEWQQAISLRQQALNIFQELGDRHGQAKVLTNLGNLFSDQSDWQRAAEHWQEALAIFEELGAPEADRVRMLLEQLNRPRRRWWPFDRKT